MKEPGSIVIGWGQVAIIIDRNYVPNLHVFGKPVLHEPIRQECIFVSLKCLALILSTLEDKQFLG